MTAVIPLADPRRMPPRWYLLILLFYFTLMGLGLGELRALTRHEVFAAEPAREMLRAKDWGPWIIQEFGGKPRYEKPPAMSWLIAASISAFGEREWAARLPAVLAGGVIVLLVTEWARRIYGRDAAIIAGLMQATFFYVVMQARLAEVDMPLCAVVALGMFAIGWAWVPAVDLPVLAPPKNRKAREATQAAADLAARKEASRREWLGWVFAICAGTAFMLKGPVGSAVMYLGAFGFAWVVGSKKVLWWVVHPGRVILFLTLAISWPWAAYLHDPKIWGQWTGEVARRTGEVESVVEPFWFYVWNVPMLLLPWVLLLIPAAAAVWSARPKLEATQTLVQKLSVFWSTPHARFLWAWFLPGFILLSAFPGKHKHYCLPLLPGLTPVLAWGLLVYLRHQYSQRPRLYWLWMALWAGVLGVGIAVVLKKVPEHPKNIASVIATLLVGGVLVLAFEWRRLRTAQLVAIFGTAWAVLASINLQITPVFDTFHLTRELAKRANIAVMPGEKIYVVDQGMAQLTWYLRLPVERIDHLTDKPPEDVHWVVIPSDAVDDLAKAWNCRIERINRFSAAGGRKTRREDDLVLLEVTR